MQKQARIWDPIKQKYTYVKNLGWLLRNWKQLVCFEVRKIGNVPFDSTSGTFDLTAHLIGDRKYSINFSNGAVCRNFLNRPVFAGCPLYWINHETHTNAPCTLLWSKPVAGSLVPINDSHRKLWGEELKADC